MAKIGEIKPRIVEPITPTTKDRPAGRENGEESEEEEEKRLEEWRKNEAERRGGVDIKV